VAAMVVTGTSLEASRGAAALAAAHPGVLYATAGVHPHQAREWGDASAAALEALCAAPGVVAVGETGLDFYRDYSPRPDQARALEAQLELAAGLGLPVFLHQRGAHQPFLAILDRWLERLPRAVVHCFTGSAEELDAYLERGLHIGITGWVCDERRGQALCAGAGRVPAQRLMIETDAPFILPRNILPRPADRRNEPAFLPYVLQGLARCRGEAPQALARTTTAAARAFFGLALPAPVDATPQSV
jgi:TatD DNase family protein